MRGFPLRRVLAGKCTGAATERRRRRRGEEDSCATGAGSPCQGLLQGSSAAKQGYVKDRQSGCLEVARARETEGVLGGQRTGITLLCFEMAVSMQALFGIIVNKLSAAGCTTTCAGGQRLCTTLPHVKQPFEVVLFGQV